MILVVEDDPQVARLISLVLERNGFEVQIVADGAVALKRAGDLKPTMIFADLTIKGMSGELLCGALKSQPGTRDIPYIVVSGDRDIAEKARLCGADGFIVKPFEFNELLDLVNTYARTESRKAD